MLVIIRFFPYDVKHVDNCLENTLVGLVVTVVVVVTAAAIDLFDHKLPLVTLLDFISKKYWFLLPLICSDISCFSWSYKSRPSIALF